MEGSVFFKLYPLVLRVINYIAYYRFDISPKI